MSKPKIRFKGYEEDWEQRKLSKVAKYRNGKAHENSIAENGKYIVVNSKFVSTDGRVRKFSNEQIEPLYKGEIAFVLSDVPNGRAIARTFLVDKDGKYTLNQRIAGITPYENTDSYFLHILMNRNRYFLKFDDGNKQTNLSVNDVTNFEEKYPSYEEQYKIGQCFSNLDHLITLHQRKCEETKKLKKYMLQKMFPQNRKRVPEIRFAGFTDDWEQRKLSKVAKYRNGKAHENSIAENGKYIVVNSKFVSTDGRVRKFSNEQIEPLYKGEIAFVLSDVPNGRAIARTFLVDKDGKYTLNQRIAGITPYENTDSYFLHILMNRNRYFLKFDDGNKQTNLSVNDVTNFEEKYPSYEEQYKIGQCFSNLDHLITLHQRKCEETKKLKKYMLQKMFPQNRKRVPEIRFAGFTDDWEQRKLKNEAEFGKGNGYSKSDLTEFGTPIILYGRLYTKYENLISDVDTFVNTKDGSVYSEGGEVIVPASGETAIDIARAATVEKAGILLGGDLNIIKPNNNIDSKFLSLSISNGNSQRELAKKAQGKSVVHIHNKEIQDLIIPFPCIEEQKNISKYFFKLDRLITLHQCK